MTPELTPFLEVRDQEVFLGEEIVFRRGLRSATRVPADELWGRTCRLVVRAPDGLVTVHPRGPSSYDGPSTIRSFAHRECLNDLAAPLAPGEYELIYEHEGREGRARIDVREPATPGPIVAFDLPEQLDVEPGRALVVRFSLTNASSTPLRLVEPDSCRAASVVGYRRAKDPPSWARLTRTGEGASGDGYWTPIEAGKLDALAVAELAPGERRSYLVVFDEVFQADTDPQWRPRERFDVTVGLVVHTFDPEIARPIRWLRRATGTYLTTGARVSTGESRYEAWEWERMSPSRA